MSTFPALTLHQPWASLIAERVKTIETRSWPAPAKLVGEFIAIHAAARKPLCGEPIGEWFIVDSGPISGYGMAPIDLNDPGIWRPVPLGAVVATARLTACVPMVSDYEDAADAYEGPSAVEIGTRHDGSPRAHLYPEWGGALEWDEVTEVSDQLPYGHFEPGRWAWLLDEIAPTTERCPWCMGRPKKSSTRIEGGSTSCAHCNHTSTFNFIDRPGGPCDCERARAERCPTCLGVGRCDPVPARGRQKVWRWQP